MMAGRGRGAGKNGEKWNLKGEKKRQELDVGDSGKTHHKYKFEGECGVGREGAERKKEAIRKRILQTKKNRRGDTTRPQEDTQNYI